VDAGIIETTTIAEFRQVESRPSAEMMRADGNIAGYTTHSTIT